MSENLAPAAPAVDAPPAVTVDTLLQEACVAGATMTAKSKDAAKLAAAELDNKVASVAERVKKVVDAHATAFGDNHNVKAIFSDCLWLLAVPAAIVESKVAGDKTPKSFTAAQSVDLSKHALRDAAKQVREQEGVSRAAGGGAKKAAPVAVAAPAATPDSVFFVLLSQKLKDAGEFAKIVKAIEDAGYTVAKKGKKVAAAAPVATAPAPTMAAQLLAAAPSKAERILAAA